MVLIWIGWDVSFLGSSQFLSNFAPLKSRKGKKICNIYIYIYKRTTFEHVQAQITHPSVRPSVRPSVCLSVCLSIYLSVHPSIYPLIHPFIHSSFHTSIYLPVHLFIHPSTHPPLNYSSIAPLIYSFLVIHIPCKPQAWSKSVESGEISLT